VINKKGVEVTSFAVLLLVFALADIGMATTNDSMTSYEDLLRGQTLLIESFENLLKNTTLDSEGSYIFLDSFDDLADRQQKGLYSFEDLVSFNWTDLTIADRINLTNSFEDLLRREAVILTSNEDLLKRGFCKLPPDQKKELLDRFEDRLKFEVVLLKKFEDWLHYQQMIEIEPSGYYDTWMAFLSSFEDLIRRQSNLLDSFEMLMKIDCSGTYLTVTKSADETDVAPKQGVNYTYTITAYGYPIKNIEVKDSLWGVVGKIAELSPGPANTIKILKTLNCSDCNGCTCKVCNFAMVCGEVITDNGNFTVCNVSNQVCINVTQPPLLPSVDVYPAIKLTETAEESAAGVEVPAAETTSEASGKVIVEVTEAPVEQPKTTGCLTCGKK
jgi:hypothetical protein